MVKLNKVFCFILGVTYSLSVFANNTQPITCQKFQLHGIEQKINKLDEKFQWNDASCKIVATKSIFPRKDENSKFKYEKGMQVFVYQNYELKFICLPGWNCKAW